MADEQDEAETRRWSQSMQAHFARRNTEALARRLSEPRESPLRPREPHAVDRP
jgi:hypothetical protein